MPCQLGRVNATDVGVNASVQASRFFGGFVTSGTDWETPSVGSVRQVTPTFCQAKTSVVLVISSFAVLNPGPALWRVLYLQFLRSGIEFSRSSGLSLVCALGFL